MRFWRMRCPGAIQAAAASLCWAPTAASIWLAIYWRWTSWSLGGDDRWQRQCLDLQLCRGEQPDCPVVRSADRDLPTWLQDRRSDLATWRLRGRRPADADRSGGQSRGGCLGNE